MKIGFYHIALPVMVVLLFVLVCCFIPSCNPSIASSAEREEWKRGREIGSLMRGLPPGSKLIKYYGNYWAVIEFDDNRYLYCSLLHNSVMTKIQ